ncbi:sensor histidine kinase [Candidatus Nitrospira bockiana]
MRFVSGLTVWRVSLSLLATVAALGLTHLFLGTLQSTTFIFLFLALLLSTWYGRLEGGLLSLVIGTIGTLYANLPPFYSFDLSDPVEFFRLVLFAGIGALIVSFLHTRQELLDQRTRLLAQAAEREHLLRRKQEELIHAGKLATLGQLAAGITHELNNPLNNVGLYLGNLRDTLRAGEVDREQLLASIQEAQGQLRRAADIVSHLRVFARGGEAPRRPCSLHRVIENALRFVQDPLRLAGITAVFAPVSGDVIVEGNETQLEQVLINLLLNAKDALADAPVKRITLSTERIDGTVAVIVDDSGPGVPQELKERLFTPFLTTKPAGTGLGLGLSISYSIVKAHRGDMSVGTSPAGGARFLLTFPIVAAAEQTDAVDSTTA